MKHWKETEQILRRLADVASRARPAAVATVVRIRGSAYRRPGAKFLVEDDGRTIGCVSGGCLEADVGDVARTVMRTGVPRLLHYDTGSDDRVVWGLGLGCNGAVDIFVQSAAALLADGGLNAILERLLRNEPFALSTLINGPAAGHWLLVGREGSAEHSTGDGALDSRLIALAAHRVSSGEPGVDLSADQLVFTDVLTPPPHLIVFGAGDDARPVVSYAADAGYQVTVVDHRPAYLTPQRFPDASRLLDLRPEEETANLPVGHITSAVIMTHSLAVDREWLRLLMATEIGYIGLLGPRARTEAILEQVGATRDQRVFGPVGLDLDAEGPQQIAISIVAEVLAVGAARQPHHLRERGTSIHDLAV